MPIFTADQEEIAKGIFHLSRHEVHHLADVLRIKAGEMIEITDGAGHLYSAQVLEPVKGRVEIIKQLPAPSSPYPVHLFVALLKSDRLELILQKAVELNIQAIHLVIAKRSVRTHIGGETWKRYLRIVETAQKQCGRPHPLQLDAPVEFGRCVLEASKKEMTHFFFREDGKGESLRKLLQPNPNPPYGLWIGPEGGWDPAEVKEAEKFMQATLGPLILRSETAALHAASSVIALVF